jgi:hypothetical protein
MRGEAARAAEARRRDDVFERPLLLRGPRVERRHADEPRRRGDLEQDLVQVALRLDRPCEVPAQLVLQHGAPERGAARQQARRFRESRGRPARLPGSGGLGCCCGVSRALLVAAARALAFLLPAGASRRLGARLLFLAAGCRHAAEMHRAKKKKKKTPKPNQQQKKKQKQKKKAEPGVSIFFFFFFCFKSMRATRTIGLTAWVLLAAAVAAAQEMVLQELRRSPTAVVFEPFTGRYASRWSTSTNKKCTGIPTVRGAEQPAIEADRVLALDQAPARYCAWTPAPFNTTRLATEPLVIRFDVRRENEVPCGGAYLKLLDPRLSRAQRRGHIVTDTSGGGGGAAAQPTPPPLNDDLSISGGGGGGGGDDETGGGDGFSAQRLAAQQAAQQRAVLRSESRNGTFGPASPYALMFGPDACAARADGAGRVDQVHLILVVDGVRHRLVDPPRSRLDGDLRTHEYKLTVWPDTGAFEIQVDGFRMRHGSLADEGAFAPPLVPPSTIADPDDVEPADWPRDEFIPDPDASRPADWDESEPRMIPDPQARDPPAGWDTGVARRHWRDAARRLGRRRGRQVGAAAGRQPGVPPPRAQPPRGHVRAVDRARDPQPAVPRPLGRPLHPQPAVPRRVDPAPDTEPGAR